jgi:hypothetical protein
MVSLKEIALKLLLLMVTIIDKFVDLLLKAHRWLKKNAKSD